MICPAVLDASVDTAQNSQQKAIEVAETDVLVLDSSNASHLHQAFPSRVDTVLAIQNFGMACLIQVARKPVWGLA